MSSFSLANRGRPHLCGHRGNSLAAPENTLAAMRAVVAAGGSSAELDAVLSCDDHIVITHDLLVDRTTDGTGPVGAKTLVELQSLDAGAWFDARFAGERLPTLRAMLDEAHRLDMVVELEIKEARRPQAMLDALARDLNDSADRARLMLISFDHAWLKTAKARLGDIRTGGISLARYADPVAVANAADLDQLCIDLAWFHPDDARALHTAGKTIRCHAYNPARMAAADRSGLAWRDALQGYLRDGLIDTLSGDDVGWLSDLVAETL